MSSSAIVDFKLRSDDADCGPGGPGSSLALYFDNGNVPTADADTTLTSAAQSLAYVHALDCSEPHTDSIWGLSYLPTTSSSPDSVLTASADGSLKIYASSSGQATRTHPDPKHTLAIVSLSTSPDGRYALYNSIEGLTRLWDMENGDIVGTHESYGRSKGDSDDQVEPSWSVALNPKGGTYSSTGGSGRITLHSANPTDFGTPLRKFSNEGRQKFGMFCSYSPDGTRIALSHEGGQIYLYDIETGNLETTFTSHAMTVRSMAWSYDGSLLLSASEDNNLCLHDVRLSPSKKPGSGVVATFSGHTSWVLSTDISNDGRLALSGSSDKTIKVWDIAARAAVSTIQDTGEVWCVKWKPGVGTSTFASGGQDGVVRWWRAAGTGTTVM